MSGEKATKKDLEKNFPKMSKEEIILRILDKGVTQISDLE